MRLFQNTGASRTYLARQTRLQAGKASFAARIAAILDDRYGASHILKPVYDGETDAFFTSGDDPDLQRAWAAENGLPAGATLADILLAQIEHHRAEVFYNLDPFRYDAAFVRRLPGCVRARIAWRAAPGAIDFTGYDRVVSNFPSIRADYERAGVATAALFPGHDPVLDDYAASTERDIDILFIGGFSRHHLRRRALLEAVAGLAQRWKVVFHLDRSRYAALAATPLGWFGPLATIRQPASIRAVAAPPVFGRDMYRQLGRSRIVFNAAIDMAGPDRGNMRCFEALGARAALLTDAGDYPEGMEDGRTMMVYQDSDDLVRKAEEALRSDRWQSIAGPGGDMVRETYSKAAQFRCFAQIVADV